MHHVDLPCHSKPTASTTTTTTGIQGKTSGNPCSFLKGIPGSRQGESII